MKNLNQFIAEYTADMEADNRRFIDLMFERALIIKIDLTCIDRIMQGIKDDQPRFDKWCEIMAKKQQDEDDKLCCVCYDLEATQPLKCSHQLCPTCYDKLTHCPLCRTCYKEPVVVRDEHFERELTDDWYQRPLDFFITIRNTRFVVCFRTEWFCQQWLFESHVVNWDQPDDENIIELYDVNDVIDLMECAVMRRLRFKMVLEHPLHTVILDNQENRRFRAVCTRLQHAMNLQAYIGTGRCGYSSNGPTRHLITDIPCLSDLMSFLSLPFHVQVREPS